MLVEKSMKFVVCPSRSRAAILKKIHPSGLCSDESTAAASAYLLFGCFSRDKIGMQCLFAAITFTRLCVFMMD
jgi:hypothetical protein